MWSLTLSLRGHGRSWMIWYLTESEHFLMTTPISDPTYVWKCGWLNSPAFLPRATSVMRYLLTTDPLSKADFHFLDQTVFLLPWYPISTPSCIPCNRLTPLPVWVAGQVMLEVIKIERWLCLQDDTPKLGAPAYNACRHGPICSWEDAWVGLVLDADLPTLVKDRWQLGAWAPGEGSLLLVSLVGSPALLALSSLLWCWILLQWGPWGKGQSMTSWLKHWHLKHLWADTLVAVVSSMVTYNCWSKVLKGSPCMTHFCWNCAS